MNGEKENEKVEKEKEKENREGRCKINSVNTDIINYNVLGKVTEVTLAITE